MSKIVQYANHCNPKSANGPSKPHFRSCSVLLLYTLAAPFFLE